MMADASRAYLAHLPRGELLREALHRDDPLEELAALGELED